MSKLTAKIRKALPQKDFALPGRKYPVEDKAHAANAKGRATQQFDSGHLSPGELATIIAKADAVLDGKDS